ncbi:6-phosphofructokinase [Streptomyces laurentii]|uniref:6-phosphofructokinase n=1 Tax=Streptomyces laurentii TaxID=39478 RepID=A0A160NYI8_STRLU|nr:6-phosphofructokinase [Streptomyces laurentii]
MTVRRYGFAPESPPDELVLTRWLLRLAEARIVELRQLGLLAFLRREKWLFETPTRPPTWPPRSLWPTRRAW